MAGPVKSRRPYLVVAGLVSALMLGWLLWPRAPKVVATCSAVAAALGAGNRLEGCEVVFSDGTPVPRAVLHDLQEKVLKKYLAGWKAEQSDAAQFGPGFYGGRARLVDSSGHQGNLVFECHETPNGGLIFVDDLFRAVWVFAAAPNLTRPPAGFSFDRAIADGAERDGSQLKQLGINGMKGPDGRATSFEDAITQYRNLAAIQAKVAAKFSGKPPR